VRRIDRADRHSGLNAVACVAAGEGGSVLAEHTVREARPEERERVCDCLARAFADDPITLYLLPHERGRHERLSAFYRVAIRELTAHGRLIVDEELRAAAIWQAPSPPRPGRLHMLGTMWTMVLQLRGASLRGLRLAEALEKVHIRRPHWYLGILGTDPAHQGAGLGSALVASGLEECDAQGLPAYLESSKESNIPFYEKHGFVVTGEVRVPDGPVLWSMLRVLSDEASDEARS
jgi:GNAT superfamily N-acetyltransferase